MENLENVLLANLKRFENDLLEVSDTLTLESEKIAQEYNELNELAYN